MNDLPFFVGHEVTSKPECRSKLVDGSYRVTISQYRNDLRHPDFRTSFLRCWSHSARTMLLAGLVLPDRHDMVRAVRRVDSPKGAHPDNIVILLSPEYLAARLAWIFE